MTLKKKVALVFLAPILFLLIFVSNFSGICWTEFKKYSEEELIQKAASKAYREDPFCCDIKSKGGFFSKLFGSYYFAITQYTKRPEPINNDEHYPYNYSYFLVNQCGNYKKGSSLETTKTEEMYNGQVKIIKSKRGWNNND
ncbi:MAG: hypothetical protein O2970_07070 [Proteobacteria bacterium]|nr:hypothetical protein [Pseudomonadota bacterium]MDA0966702.1 hypothetical protein [Pseudomonadota bacterium]